MFATVTRDEAEIKLPLLKGHESERFILGEIYEFTFSSQAQRTDWEKLPSEFSWTEGIKAGLSRKMLGTVTRMGKSVGLLIQDPNTKRYRKVVQKADPNDSTS